MSSIKRCECGGKMRIVNTKNAKALMGPNMEVELVIPIGDVMFFEDGETPQPVYFLLLFPHIR